MRLKQTKVNEISNVTYFDIFKYIFSPRFDYIKPLNPPNYPMNVNVLHHGFQLRMVDRLERPVNRVIALARVYVMHVGIVYTLL